MAAAKLSPPTQQKIWSKNSGEVKCFLQVRDLTAFHQVLQERNIEPAAVHREYPRWNGILISLTYRDLQEWVLQEELVLFVDVREVAPQPERAIRGLDLSLNGLNLVQQETPGINGQGETISIKENAFDSTDIDLRSRYVPSVLRDQFVATHATNMATLAAGGGNSFYLGKGAASGSRLSSSSFDNLFPDPEAYFTDQGIRVQNHSYGLGIENYYGGEAMAYDDQAYQRDDLMHIFSAGNLGDVVGTTGRYQEVVGYANLTGNMKMGKNILTVGAVDTALRVSPFSSRGPAYDGRIKPELVAAGEDGSSGAAALTSGTVALLQQIYATQFGSPAPIGLLRAILLNSADELGAPGPDFHSGYGNLDAWGATQTLLEQRFFSGTLVEGEGKSFQVVLPEGASDLRVTLAWTDPPARVNAEKALVNDLDLSLVAGNTDTTWLPWVLSTFPAADSLALRARRGEDHVNNQEQVSLEMPAATTYTINVRANELVTEEQAFYVAYEWRTPGFAWRYPLRDDPVETGDTRMLRWATTLRGAGSLAYRRLNEASWNRIGDIDDLAVGYFNWSVPPAGGPAQVRMITPRDTFLTDTFLLSQALDLAVAFECAEDFLLHWPFDPEAMDYQLLGLTEGSLTPLITTEDTLVLLDKTAYPYQYFSVAPRYFPERSGINGPTINLAFQAAGCYVQRFTGNLTGNEVVLELLLGSLFEIDKVIIEKKAATGFVPLLTTDQPGSTLISAIDGALVDGQNIYRVTVLRNDGLRYTSEEIAFLYLSTNYLVYPNPTSADEGAVILTRDLPADATFSLFMADGRRLSVFPVANGETEIPLADLAAGPYYYRLSGGGKLLTAGLLMVH